VYLPFIANAHVFQDGHSANSVRDGDASVVEVGSGSYTFEVR
jgi:hypothetical protein